MRLSLASITGDETATSSTEDEPRVQDNATEQAVADVSEVLLKAMKDADTKATDGGPEPGALKAADVLRGITMRLLSPQSRTADEAAYSSASELAAFRVGGDEADMPGGSLRGLEPVSSVRARVDPISQSFAFRRASCSLRVVGDPIQPLQSFRRGPSRRRLVDHTPAAPPMAESAELESQAEGDSVSKKHLLDRVMRVPELRWAGLFTAMKVGSMPFHS